MSASLLRRAIIHYWWVGVVVLAGALLGGLVVAATESGDRQATAQIVVTPDRKLGRNLQAVQLVVPTLVEQIDAPATFIATQAGLPATLRGVEWRADITTDSEALLISVTVTSPDEDAVVPIANAYASEVVASRADDALADYRVLRLADDPTPVADRNRPILVGLVAGVLLGLLAMVTAQARRPLVTSSKDLRGLGIPVLGDVDHAPSEYPTHRVMADDGPLSRTYERLALSIDAARVAAGRPAAAVVAIDLDDGAAGVAAGLAWAGAVLGRPVGAVEADPRRPGLHRHLGVPRSPRDRSIRGAPPSLRVPPLNVGDGSASGARARVEAALEADRADGAASILSAPPLVDTAEALVAARLAGAAVLVVRRGGHSRFSIEAALAELRRADVPVLGVVVTRERRGGVAGATPLAEETLIARHPVVGGPAAVDPDAEQPLHDEPAVAPTGSRARSTIRNGAYVFVQTGMAPLLNVLLLPVLVNELGLVQYGVFATLQAVFVFTSVFDLGLSKSVVKYVSAFWTKGDTASISRFTSTAFTLYLVLGFLVFVASVGVAVLGVGILGVPDDLQDEAMLAALVFGATSFYNFPAGTLGGVLGGLKRHDTESRLHIVVAVLQAVGQAAAAFAGLGLLAVVIAFNAPQYIRPWVRLRIIRRMVPDFRISPRLFSRATLREIGGYSVWSFMVDLGRNVVGNFGIVVVASFLGPATAASYNIGTQVGRLLQRMTLPVAFVLLPLASEFDATGDRRAARRLIERASRYTTAISIALAGPLIVLAPDVIRVWLGEPLPLAVDVARIFLVVSVFLMVRAPLSNVLEGSAAGVRTAGIWIALESVASIALSIVLVQTGGARGAVLGVLAAVMLASVIGIIPAALRRYDIGIPEYLRASALPPLVPLAVAVLPWLGIAYAVSGRGLVVVLAGLAASIGVYLVAFWFLLPRRERDDLGPALLGRFGLRRSDARRSTGSDQPGRGSRETPVRR